MPAIGSAELRRRAEKAAAASRLVTGVLDGKTMTRRRGETERQAEAREMAARLKPMTDAEIAAMTRSEEAQP